MKITNLSLVASCLMVFLFSSCLGNSGELVTYNDTAITSFSISTLRQLVHTKASTGVDSTYLTDFGASSYKFYIDPLRKEIYNPDSLPVGVNAKKVVCSLTAKNGGSIALMNIKGDSINLFNASDSIDFSVPRTFVVYSEAGADSAHYTIRVNVHKEVGTDFKWSKMTVSNASLAALTSMKAFTMNGNIFVFGNKDLQAKIYKASLMSGADWQEVTPNVQMTTGFYQNVIAKSGALYAYQDGALLKSTDARTWTKVADASLQRLLGASDAKIYAMDVNGSIVVSTDNGVSWTAEELDSDASLLPQSDINFTVQPLVTNAGTNRLLLIGSTGSVMSIWGKVEENDAYAQNQPWLYYTPSSTNKYPLPNLTNLQVAKYGDGLAAIGGAGKGASSSVPAFDQIYYSFDGGLTWKENGTMEYPSGFNSSQTSFAMTVDTDNYLWIVCGGTGQVWKGRLNKLGWTTVEKVFTE